MSSTLAQRLRVAAEAENVRRHVTRSHLDGMVRWKGRPSSIGPFLLRVLQTGPETWSALEVVKVECGRDGHSEHFYQRTGAIIANADSTDAAIRAGLLALAERLEASNG